MLRRFAPRNDIYNHEILTCNEYIIDVCYGGLGIVEKPKINYDDQQQKIDFEVLKYQSDKRSRNIIAAGGKKEEAVDGLFTRILKN